mmetsp:Transcript_140980/g.351553  ORF Transcript_140980/g.351553 Transcript_140980/m.351553 type:complete len:82 (+) Transcript_140980:2147-2392(+)
MSDSTQLRASPRGYGWWGSRLGTSLYEPPSEWFEKSSREFRDRGDLVFVPRSLLLRGWCSCMDLLPDLRASCKSDFPDLGE